MALESKRELMEDDYLDLQPSHGSEELESEVRRAKAELDELRRKQDQIEKEKLRLEELSRRQDAIEEGKNELVGKLSNALALIEREMEDAQQRLEHLKIVNKDFADHLSVLESIHPRSWSSSEVGKELGRSQAAIDEARTEYNKAKARLSFELPAASDLEDGEEYEQEYEAKDFAYWLKSGFAFTLPLQIFAAFGLILWVWSLLAAK